MTVTVVVGNPRPSSRTLTMAVQVASDVSNAAPEHVIDLAELGPRLFDWTDPTVEEAVSLVHSSQLIVVASPTYKATYTGLLKLFLERFAADELAGIVGIPLMVGAATDHSLAVETHLRPLLVEIGLSTPTRGLYLIDKQGTESPNYPNWLATAHRQLSTGVDGR